MFTSSFNIFDVGKDENCKVGGGRVCIWNRRYGCQGHVRRQAPHCVGHGQGNDDDDSSFGKNDGR